MITYINLSQGHNFLSLVTDAYSRKIVGCHLSEHLTAAGPIAALQMAIQSCSDTGGLIHHSDSGSQYCCSDYVEILQDNEISISMTQSGDPRDNAIAERVNGILKREASMKENQT
ncbi:MAG: DDE-type integrase/transposase/recombinase [Mucilaginibacter sp.]